MDPFAGKPVPPPGLLARLAFYGRRNGFLYAVLSYIGRRSQRAWSVVAPLFTSRKINEWLAKPGPHILNLGGGANVYDRWLTADVDPRADVYVDITHPLPFRDATVDVVYLEEVIEHVARPVGMALVSECHRILKPGGVLRLTTPDLDQFAHGFDASDGFAQRINDIFYGHGHRHIYSRAGIQALLTQAGFTRVDASSFRDPASRFAQFDTHPLRYPSFESELSQYWEAVKDG